MEPVDLYQRMSANLTKDTLKTNIKAMCQSLITPDIKRLVIANKKKRKVSYVCVIESQRVMLLIQKTQTNDVYNYDVDADALSVNNQSKGASFVRTFIQYLNRIGEDMLANNTQQFQEPKPGGAHG